MSFRIVSDILCDFLVICVDLCPCAQEPSAYTKYALCVALNSLSLYLDVSSYELFYSAQLDPFLLGHAPAYGLIWFCRTWSLCNSGESFEKEDELIAMNIK